MSLADVVEKVRTGIVQISFLAGNGQRLGGGTGFLARQRLLTNHHVFMGHQGAHTVRLHREQLAPFDLAPAVFVASLRSGSMENSFDYAIQEIPELFDGSEHQFELELPGARRIGDPIALLGFPLEHQNLTVHTGVISSFFQSGVADVIQLDASVNAGNSGGPLIDPETAVAFGMVTRKATGLTAIFAQLREALDQNIQFAQQAAGMMLMGNFDPVQGFIATQSQVRATLGEIERQANVGIGYAVSTAHVLADAHLPQP